MSYTPKTTHVTDSLALLLEQFKGRPNLAAWLTSYATQIQELETAIAAMFYTQLSIDDSVGPQLDAIGVVVGIARPTNMSDVDYRDRLRVQILINLASGTVPEINAIFELLTTSPFSVVYDGTATIRATINEPITNGPALAETLAKAKLAGVKAFLTYVDASTGDDFFSFGPDPDVEGDSFGLDSTGGFAALIEV